MKIWEGILGEDEINLHMISILSDNYCYVLTWEGKALVVDPGEAAPVAKFLKEEKLELEAIFATHHHQDHIGGVEALRSDFGGKFMAPEDDRIPNIDQTFQADEELFVGPFDIKVLATPGHSKTHISLFFQGAKLLFCGDVLFSGGCGRLIEGDAAELFGSIESFKTLPKESLILCGHEYTLSNVQFDLSVDPDNETLKERLGQVQNLRNEGLPTIPTTLEFEMRTNPFMRTNNREIRRQLNMEQATDLEVFTQLRRLKDDF